MDITHWTAYGVAAAGIITAIATAMSTRRKDAIGEWATIVERQDKERERQDKEIAKLQEQNNRQQQDIDESWLELDDVRRAHSDCQIEMNEVYSLVARLHGQAQSQAECLRKLGGSPAPVPDLPPRRQKPGGRP